MATLFDQASLVMIPSGFKDDKLYSIKPVERLGSDVVINGSFATDSDWTKGTGTTISGGTANFSNAGGVALYQDIGTQSGSVKVTFTISNYSSGTLNVYSGGNQSVSNINVVGNANGFYSCYVDRSGGNTNIIFGSSNNFTGSIDNVSIKEVITASGDFTFSRDGSGASPATRVNSAGLIEKGRTNLLLQSNQFDTTWALTSASVTSGQSGYDGTNNAWELLSTGASCRPSQTISTTGVQTMSVYAKAGSVDWMALYVVSTSPPYVYFDLANGVLGGVQNNVIDAGIDDVGNGWYRCYISFNKTATEVRIFTANGNGSLTTASGDSIYIQNAQLEKGLISTNYIATTTAAASAGILGDMPRLDYTGGASCPSLLLEPSRTNLVPFSEYFDGYTKYSVIVTNNFSTSPEGVQNASKLTDTDSYDTIRKDISVVSGSTYTISIFAKNPSSGEFALRAYSGSGNDTRRLFNLNDLTITSAGGDNSGLVSGSDKIEDYGNGWYRCSFSYIPTSTNLELNIYPDNPTNASSNSVEVYGFQAEAGSYPTSYIPTYGSATARAKDFFLMNLITNGITTASQTEASLFVEFEKPNTNENVDLMRWKGSGTLGRGYIYNKGVGFASDWATSQNFTIGENTKVVWRLNSLSDGVEFLNGTKGSGASGTAWSDIRELRFNAEGPGGVLKIKQICIFPTALTDAECVALTTL